MKKQFISCLLVAAALLLPAALSAQPASWAAHHFYTDTPGENAVIRNWNDQFVVAAYQVVDTQYLAIWRVRDFTNNAPGAIVSADLHTISLTTSINIKDFRIIGDTLVFCGTWTSLSAYGWMKIDTNYSYSAIHVYYIGSPITSLNRLAVYREGSGLHMVAIGSNNMYSYIAEVPDVLSGTTQVLTARMNATSAAMRDQLDDVAALDDRIVIVGRDTRAGADVVSLRVTEKATGVVNSAELVYQYRIPLAGRTVLPPVLVSRTWTAQNFGVACRWEIPGVDYRLRLHHMTISGTGSPLLLNTQDAAADRLDTLQEMTCLYNELMLPLVQRAGTTSRFIPLQMPAPGTYSTSVYTQAGRHFLSLDRLGNNSFATWGDNYNILLQKIMTPPAPTCLGTETVISTPVDNTPVNRLTDMPTRVKYTATYTPITEYWGPRTVFLECNNSL